MRFIDVHCHLDMCVDIAGAITRARAAGVATIITQGVNPASNRAALELAARHGEVKAALGLYPIDALSLDDTAIDEEMHFIRTQRKSVTAIGEVGLDFKDDTEKNEQQKYVFRKIISLAHELQKPLIVHSRYAENECIALLEEASAKRVIMHCFSGKWSLVQRIIANGWFLTVPTHVTRSEQIQRIAREIPLKYLLCETDAPFLHPQKLDNNEPALVVESYKMIALLKGLPLEDVATMIEKNYARLFSSA